MKGPFATLDRRGESCPHANRRKHIARRISGVRRATEQVTAMNGGIKSFEFFYLDVPEPNRRARVFALEPDFAFGGQFGERRA